MDREKPLKSFERNPNCQTAVGKESLTKQAFQDDCDINKIMKRHRITGLIEHLNPRTPMYGDYSGVTDFHEALELVSDAQEQFDALPSEVRSLVRNDPEVLLRALTDEKETAALAAAGLPMAEGYIPYEEPEEEKADPPALEEKGAEETAAITGGE